MVGAEVTQTEVSIPLDETSYGAGRHAVVVLSAPTKKALMKYIAECRYHRTHEGDRPGQMYATGLECLRYMKGDGFWQAICISSTYWDV